MTIAFDDRYIASTPVSLTAAFPVDFPIFALSDVSVYISGVRTFDFSVSGTAVDGQINDAIVTLNTAVSNVTVEIYGTIQPDRTNDLPSGGEGVVSALEVEMDRITASQQEILRDANADLGAVAAKIAAEAAQTAAETAAASVTTAASDIAELVLAQETYITSTELTSGSDQLFDVDRGSGKSVAPASGDWLKFYMHDSKPAGSNLKIRLVDGATTGNYYFVKALSGGLNKIQLTTANNYAHLGAKSAEMWCRFDGTDWVVRFWRGVQGTGALNVFSLDENGDIPAVGGINLTGIPTAFLHVQEQQASGTSGGTFTAGADQTRVLNTVLTNEIAGASLASNQITLPAGSYEIVASAPAYLVNEHKAWLYNVTGAAILITGTSEYSNAATQTRSWISGRFTLGATSVVEVRHRCGATRATNGFGVTSSLGTEIYTDAQMRKVS